MASRFDPRELGRVPIVVAPMGGGPSTVELVVAAAEAGALGFLAAGYKTAEAMQAEIEAVGKATDRAFGVNVFVPQLPAVAPEVVAAYVATLEPEAARLGVAAAEPAWDDDHWNAKIGLLLEDPPPAVSFTFGCPPAEIVAALRAAGATVAVTVTTPEEAEEAVAAGADCLCLQGFEAGAHRGSFANDDEPGQDWGLLALIGAVIRLTDVPLLAAGGITGPAGVAAVLAAGATAAQVGTAFLRCPESGAHPIHKAALADARYTTTAVTRAFSGRRARGLVNRFMVDHPGAPPAYPQINNATRPLRAAAAGAGDAGGMSLWAGQGFRAAEERPAGEVVERLAAGVKGGRRRPTLAPIWPPTTDPAAIRSAGPQATWVTAMNTSAATRLTSPDSRFLAALMRCSPSSRPRPRRAISSTPWAAPKYPP
jgi:nitronate monooxygenase